MIIIKEERENKLREQQPEEPNREGVQVFLKESE
jgi:hypothetical protein